MKHEICKTCHGTGQITDVSTNTQGYTKTTCIDCGGLKYKLVPESNTDPKDVDPDDPRAMQSDEYEAERLGVVIFLIGGSLLGLAFGVRVFRIAYSWSELPPWYYLAVISVVGVIAWRFRSIVATLAWLAVAGAIIYWGGGFVMDTFF